MLLTNAAVSRRSTVFFLMIVVSIVGLYSYVTLPRESNPDITIPIILVQTTYEGAASEDVENLITIPLERKLKSLKDVKEIRSVSAEGASMVTVEYMPDVIIDDALQKVRDKVDQAKRDLPDDLENDPAIIEINLSEFPIMKVAISGDLGERVLKQIAEEFEDRFEEIPGVLEVDVTGVRAREIRVEFDPDRMAAYKLSFTEILSLVQRENVNVPGGSIDLGRGKYMLRVPGEFTDPSDIDNLVLVAREGRPIYLKDVATIRDTFEDATDVSRLNGRSSVTLSIKKRTGENIINVSQHAFAILDAARSVLPLGVEFTVTLNESKDIQRMVNELENNILTALVLVLTVLFLFLGVRSSFIVALAIPFSFFISFTILQAMGITLNMVVLFSLILALGMLVDNAIVIVENIYRHIEEGKDPVEAAKTAAAEVGWPVIASTITTLCAFGPMLFWPDIMGEFMSYLPRTLIIVLTSSLFVALVINPVVAASTMRARPGRRKKDRGYPILIRGYRKTLQLTLKSWLSKLAVVVISIAMLFGTIGAYIASDPEVELFPETDPNRALVQVEAPQGTNLDTTNGFALEVESIIGGEKDIRYMTGEVGVASESGEGGDSRSATVSVEFVEREERSESSIIAVDRMREMLSNITGADIKVAKEKMGPPVGAPVEIEFIGADVEVLAELVEVAKNLIEGVQGLVDVKDDLSRAKPEIAFHVDREKAALLGLSTIEISNTIKAAVNGWKIGDYREGEDEYDIIARLPEKNRQTLSQIESLIIPTASGEPVPLSSVATVEMRTGYGSIRHLDQKRLIRISGNTAGRSSIEILQDVQSKLSSLELPAGYSVNYAGDQEEQQRSTEFLSRAFIIAIFLIFLVLLTQFNSLAQSLIVISSVVLSLMGVFMGLMITGMPFGIIMTGIGVISLAGVVVNNAIVLIDYINLLRKDGMELYDALVTAGTVRFRPVMLTAITTILGLTPMAIGISFDFRSMSLQVGGESAQWWGPMAVAVIFGLAVATLLTLIVVPVLYSISETFSIRGIVRKIMSYGKGEPVEEG
ncbi:MAG: efflux RND transporter permease subunit [bacterium]|nr:efflux RND transporter permease subunit [bacterium]MDT8366487.1 efflux RND transporter permease subunit [bacterium]